jgi:hypothetical protein
MGARQSNATVLIARACGKAQGGRAVGVIINLMHSTRESIG